MKLKKKIILGISFILIIVSCSYAMVFLSRSTPKNDTNAAIILLDNFQSNNQFNIESSQIIAWEQYGIAVCNSTDDQDGLQICYDGNGGAILVWYDYRKGNGDIYAQRISSDGTPLWENNGTLICNATDNQLYPQICCDNSGGAIITWQDQRGGGLNEWIYAQKISADGITQWDDNGTVICNASYRQSSPQICCDGNDGAIITWDEFRDSDWNIYAQKISSDGITQWDDNGTVICNASNDQVEVQICGDDTGGAIVGWQDNRTGNLDIYAQKISSDGITQWDDNGTVISNATNDQVAVQICGDDAGGAIVGWQDNRTGNLDIYAQRISSDGITQWDDNGTVISNATNDQDTYHLCCNSVGGAVFVWEDNRLVGNIDIYAQKISSDGITQWDDNGTVVCNASENQYRPKLCCSGDGEVIFTWDDVRNFLTTSYDIYAQKMDSDGNALWNDNGEGICNQIEYQMFPILCCDDTNGAIIAWRDFRNPDPLEPPDIYAQKIVENIAPSPEGALPPDVSYSYGSSGNSITWTFIDDLVSNPTYTIYNNSIPISEHTDEQWTSEVPINLVIDGLSIDSYNFTIIIIDGLGEQFQDEVIVNVTEHANENGLIPPLLPTSEEQIPSFPPLILVFTTAFTLLLSVIKMRKRKGVKLE